MLLVLCSSGRRSVSIDPTAVRQCSLCSIEKRVGAPLTHNIYSIPSAHKTRPTYWLLSDSQLRALQFFKCDTFSCILCNFMINNTAKVIKVKHYTYNVLLLFNCNKLNCINHCSLGKVLISLLFFHPSCL